MDWISVDDRLPPPGMQVFTLWDDCGELSPGIGTLYEWEHGDYFESDVSVMDFCYDVKYWLPIPDPPTANADQ